MFLKILKTIRVKRLFHLDPNLIQTWSDLQIWNNGSSVYQWHYIHTHPICPQARSYKVISINFLYTNSSDALFPQWISFKRIGRTEVSPFSPVQSGSSPLTLLSYPASCCFTPCFRCLMLQFIINQKNPSIHQFWKAQYMHACVTLINLVT